MAKKRGDLTTRLEQFAAALETAAGANLVSLVLYGSAADGGHTDRSDINLLLVLRDARAAALRSLAGPFHDWVRHGERPPLVFSADGWRRAADVFPLEVEDIRARHRVLRGTNPVADLSTTRDDLRRSLEREARGLLIQLSASYVGAARDGRALGAVVRDSMRTVLVLFRAAVRLLPGPAPTDAAAIVAAVAAAAGFDPAAFAWALAQRTAGRATDLQPHDPIAAAHVDAVAAFVEFIDRF